MSHLRLRVVAAASAVFLPYLSAQAQTGAGQTPSTTSAASDDAPLRFETYQGPPIYLDETSGGLPNPIVVEVTPITERYPDGTVRIQRSLKKMSDDSFVADGAYREFHPNGQVFLTGSINDGVPVGEWKYFHPNGQLRQAIAHKNGQIDGSWDIFRDSGVREGSRSFQGGVRHGEWKFYDETGDGVLATMTYNRGTIDGETKRFYANGKLRQQRFFDNGKAVGTHLEWDEDGNKRVELNYRAGKLHGMSRKWDDQGNVTNREYRDGLPVLDVGAASASDNG